MEDWAIRLIDWGGYPAVFLLSLIETLVVPMPSEVILPIAGMRAANGPLELQGVIGASTAGSMTGNLIWFLGASSLDPARLQAFFERHGRWLGVSWPEVEAVRRLFARRGAGLVLTGRLLPLVRTLVSIPAGLAKMRLFTYLLWSTIGTAAFAAAFAGAGYYAGAQSAGIEEVAGPVSSAVLIGIALWYVWSQITWKMRMARRAAASPEGLKREDV